uniref:Lipoprotein n=1 Tax=candidate division WOR-3 bacterium TaxID=2052148 RepID=A0A7C4YIN4_UNCW3
MKKIIVILTLFTLFGCATLSQVAKDVLTHLPEGLFLLKLVLNQGEVMSYHIQSTNKNKIEFLGKTQTFDIIIDSDISMLVKKISLDTISLEVKIENINGNISSDKGTISISGIDKLNGKRFDLTIKDNGDVINAGKVDGIKEFNDILSKIVGIFIFVPAKSIKIGDSWNKNSNIENEKGNYTFVLKDLIKENKFGIIEEKGIIQMKGKREIMGVNVDFNMSGNQNSEITVSMRKGIPVEKRTTINIEGTATVSPLNTPVKLYVENTILFKMK